MLQPILAWNIPFQGILMWGRPFGRWIVLNQINSRPPEYHWDMEGFMGTYNPTCNPLSAAHVFPSLPNAIPSGQDLMVSQRLFVLSIQHTTDVPWCGQRSWQQKQTQAKADLEDLHKLRVQAMVICLLQHYCEHADLKNLCSAFLYTRPGRRFPTFSRELFSIVVLRVFADVQLQVNVDLSKDNMCVTPRCTCRWRTSHAEHRRSRVRILVGG